LEDQSFATKKAIKNSKAKANVLSTQEFRAIYWICQIYSARQRTFCIARLKNGGSNIENWSS
jgi:hypothetical protein